MKNLRIQILHVAIIITDHVAKKNVEAETKGNDEHREDDDDLYQRPQDFQEHHNIDPKEIKSVEGEK